MIYTLTVKLKQHTPLIHFQHDQEGATLRASEVKPRLDKYILNKLTSKECAQGKNEGWIKKRNEKVWLDYSLRVIPCERDKNREMRESMSLYFGNLGAAIKKYPSFYKSIVLLFYSNKSETLDSIRQHIVFFFLSNNFGTRQTKGYGSFTVAKVDEEDRLDGTSISDMRPIGYKSFFTSDKDEVFTDIGLFHKTLRSGINGQAPDSLYFKSLMFAYAGDTIWDKKSVKYHFLNEETKNEVAKRRENNLKKIKNKGKLPRKSNPSLNDYRHWRDPTNSESGLFNYRDYLGFSTSETWMAYDTGEFRQDKNDSTKVATNKKGEYELKKMTVSKSFDKTFKDVGRFKSPIVYKPIQSSSGQWTVYIFANDKDISELKGKTVYYKSNMPKTRPFSLDMLSSFSVTEFLDKSFSYGDDVKEFFSVNYSKFDREKSTNRPSDNDTYDRIVRIYSELKANIV